jgi:hypothetical protein
MSEVLFIAIDPCILALVEDLQQLIEPKIRTESDYSSGIKRIFDARPAVVFLQHQMGDVACDKLANQVNMLLDGDSVPLVLLSEDAVASFSAASTYLACLDLCLPPQELYRQAQQLLLTLPGIPWKDSAGPAALEPAAPAAGAPYQPTMELTLPAGSSDFATPFPWLGDTVEAAAASSLSAGGGSLAALEGNAVTALEPGKDDPFAQEPQFLASFLEDRFVIEPLPFAFDEPLPQEKPAPSFAKDPPAIFSESHRIEKEDPNLVFGSMTDAPAEPLPFSAPRPIGPRPTGKVPPGARESGAPAAQKRGAASRDAAPQRSASTDGAPADASPRQPAAQAQQSWLAPGEPLPASAAALLGIQESPSWYYPAVAVGLFLLIGVASLNLYVMLHPEAEKPDLSQKMYELESKLQTAKPASPAPAQLPQFIPQVAPDPGYPAGHPGWERYRADALEYLVYREKGSLRAIQVLGEARGAITEAYLKTCIRLSSGREDFAVQKTQEASGIRVSTGTLQNGAELVVYRAVADGGIRGFVLSFPGQGPAAAQDAKK